ncbi:MAG TPA: T9SS type A sorting domain-containing protein [Chitinophagales bacterium]|nr:T9SS type A sorting domain-containing protein [Chitinophagales bacterium]
MKNFFLCLLLLTVVQAKAIIHVIEVEDDQFNPANLTVSVGDTIQWSRDIGNVHPHTVTSGDIPDSAATFDAPIESVTPTFTYVVQLPGVYDYICTIHAGMAGRFTAVGPSTIKATTQDAFLKVVNPVRGQKLMFFYELKKAGSTDITLTDLQGSKIMEINGGMRASGSYQEEYFLPLLPKGIYLLQLKTAKTTITRQVML